MGALQALVCMISAVALGTSACGYTSSYVPPDSSRARPVYVQDTIQEVGPAELPRCAWEVLPHESGQGHVPTMFIDESGYWARRSGPNVVVVGAPVVFVGPGLPVPSPPGPHNLLLAGFGAGPRGGGSGGGHGDAAIVLLAVVAMLAVAAASATAIGVAAAPAEKGPESAAGIDAVNRYNDAARAKMTECMRQVQPGASW